MNIAAITGSSGAGKTTLLTQLIARYVSEGKRVGAIKHTHHPLNEENRGDTARFRSAGADPVVLAGTNEAVIFRAGGTSRIRYEHVRELPALFDVDLLLIEGFRGAGDWSGVTITAGDRPTLDALAANLDRIWRAT